MLEQDKSIVLASEEVNRRNTEAAIIHGNETRKMLRLLEQRMASVEELFRAQTNLITQLREQLAKLQQQFYAKGSTSYVDKQ